jgi:hypothetical protein
MIRLLSFFGAINAKYLEMKHGLCDIHRKAELCFTFFAGFVCTYFLVITVHSSALFKKSDALRQLITAPRV